ncbi:MAG TPA: TRAP transporter large permease, partial [Casimicrobiaceae bacterium]|nr:TRAP transporter large permease [Casimicrobiaceae bacterium]
MTLLVIGVIFFATIVIGVPIAFGMGLAGSTWLIFFQEMEPTILARRFYYALNSFPLLAIPLFIMLGILADRARMLPHLVTWLQMILGRLRGGMAYINVVSAMLFAGISGTAVSDIASLGRTLIKLMTGAGYPLTYSAALTSATSIIGPIIPPSVAMIIYALAVGNVSVGAMFAGGAIPGVLFGLGFIAMAFVTTRRGGYGVVQPWPSPRKFAMQTLRVIPLIILPIIIAGGIFSGVFTVTESAAVGVAYTVLVGVCSKPRLRWKDVYDATMYSAVVSAVAGMLLGAGAIVSWILTFNRVTQDLADLLLSLSVGPIGYMLIVVVVLLILGMLMDAVPIMIALAPLLAPIAKQYGISDIHFGL